MMTLSSNGTLAIHRPERTIILEHITPAQREQALISIGYRPVVARAVAAGDLAMRTRTIGLARYIGLLAPIDTTVAREAGLVR